MTVVLLVGFSSVLAVAAIAAGVFAIWRTAALAAVTDERTATRLADFEATVANLQKELAGHAAQLVDLHQIPAGMSPALPRPALNLSRRSQALRMHRKGDAPDRIAAALGVPLQEVDLLIKVHRIVLDSL
ncbi:MAG TPA: hypothetical protein VHW09_21075 [Bryobacteraceae bacterium]|nr:hypothetical protein [Bryobacteraceae bacterium]